MTKLLTIDQVAEKLSVTTRTIHNWMRENKIPVTRMPGGGLRFDSGAIESWIKSRTVNAKPVGAL